MRIREKIIEAAPGILTDRIWLLSAFPGVISKDWIKIARIILRFAFRPSISVVCVNIPGGYIILVWKSMPHQRKIFSVQVIARGDFVFELHSITDEKDYIFR